MMAHNKEMDELAARKTQQKRGAEFKQAATQVLTPREQKVQEVLPTKPVLA